MNEAKLINTSTILEKKKASRAFQRSQFEALSETGIEHLHQLLKTGENQVITLFMVFG